MVKTSRRWCFTINNPSIQDILDLDFTQPIWKNNVRLAIHSLEHSGNIGENEESKEDSALTPHFQGYLELVREKNLRWLKTRMKRAHLETAKGTRMQNIHYCLKEFADTSTLALNMNKKYWYYFSEESSLDWNQLNEKLDAYRQSQTRSSGATLTRRQQTLMKMKEMIDSNKSNKDLADLDFPTFISCYRGLYAYRLLTTVPRNHEMEIYVLQGPTGTGKSKWCMDNYPNAYWKQRGQWWDNYSGEETVIIDEYYGWLPYDTLLRLCDRYPLLVEIKGGQVQFTSRRIIITTNAVPNTWYKDVYWPAFERRVKMAYFPSLGNACLLRRI